MDDKRMARIIYNLYVDGLRIYKLWINSLLNGEGRGAICEIRS